MIHKSDVLDILNEFPEQIKESAKIARKAGINISGRINNAVVCGVGAAGNAADICSALTNKIPIFSCKDYKVPNFVNKNSLVIVLSYSGNSEATLSAYKDAKRKNAKIVIATSNKELAKKEKKSIIIPEELIPRFSFAYLVMSAAVVLANAKIIPNQNIAEIISSLNVKSCSRQGFLIARKLKNKIPLVYSSPGLYSVAYRIKCSINEKSKNMCFSNIITDACHNEMISYKRFPKRFEVILIKDEKESKGIDNHINAFKKILKNKDIIELELKGKSALGKLLQGCYTGDYIAYYLALMNKEDPFKIKIVQEFRENLK